MENRDLDAARIHLKMQQKNLPLRGKRKTKDLLKVRQISPVIAINEVTIPNFIFADNFYRKLF